MREYMLQSYSISWEKETKWASSRRSMDTNRCSWSSGRACTAKECILTNYHDDESEWRSAHQEVSLDTVNIHRKDNLKDLSPQGNRRTSSNLFWILSLKSFEHAECTTKKTLITMRRSAPVSDGHTYLICKISFLAAQLHFWRIILLLFKI